MDYFQPRKSPIRLYGDLCNRARGLPFRNPGHLVLKRGLGIPQRRRREKGQILKRRVDLHRLRLRWIGPSFDYPIPWLHDLP